MYTILLIVALGRDPLPPIKVDRCELNYIYEACDDHWNLRLTQFIFWEWSDAHCRYQVRAWQMSKTEARPMRIGGRLLLPLYDSTHGMRLIQPRTWEPSRSTHDPEVDNRSVWPVVERGGQCGSPVLWGFMRGWHVWLSRCSVSGLVGKLPTQPIPDTLYRFTRLVKFRL